MDLDIVILAAGEGSRMKSKLPKVMNILGGKPMINHVIDTVKTLSPKSIYVVYGSGGDYVKKNLNSPDLIFIKQEKQLGTGHAVLTAASELSAKNTMILYGDVPLIRENTLRKLVENPSMLTLLLTHMDNPKGYGRIIRDADNDIKQIVEEKDASTKQRQIREVNTGILVAETKALKRWLPQIKNNNAQREFYLTDLTSLAVAQKVKVNYCVPESNNEILGINTKAELAMVERALQQRRASNLIDNGITLADPNRIDIRGNLTCESDVFIDINCIFEGKVHLASGVKIGAHSIIRETSIGNHSEILPFSHLENVRVGTNCQVGPYARLRPNTTLENNVKIGNFVEIKKSDIGTGSKINHLSYLGDAELGENVNVGAGTITCNYDGNRKHKTVIQNRAFIGSNSSLVAPVKIGEESVIGAGSTITKNTADAKLTLSRSKQKTITNWKKSKKTSNRK